jgi:hypothetical protein
LGSGSGGIIQTIHGSVADKSGTSSIPYDDTTPLSTEGTQLWSQTITPVDTANDIEVACTLTLDAYDTGHQGGGYVETVITFFRGTTCIGALAQYIGTNNEEQVSIILKDSPVTTSSTTYSCRIGRTSGSGTWYVNNA